MKTKQAVELFKAGNLKDALRIFRTFRFGFTKEERRTLEIAYECLSGNAGFYQQIGINTNSEIEKSKFILLSKYMLKSANRKI